MNTILIIVSVIVWFYVGYLVGKRKTDAEMHRLLMGLKEITDKAKQI